MKLYLTRQSNGDYMLSRFAPVKSKVFGTQKEDSYITPGEPVGVRNLCNLILKVINLDKELEIGESIKIDLTGKVLNEQGNQNKT